MIKFIPEFPEGSTRRQAERRLIKVKWGGLELLVPDEDLKQFSERAAGLYIPPEENFYDLFFWIEGERLDRLVGLPEYPGFG
ncbi:MAG: hypothetical protein IPK58_12930 [Acidobacteria bacterium]|nr:hypothetical protein [Acidobacteriota bacterium]